MRLEYKYAVPVDRLDALREDIRRFTTLDTFAARHSTLQYTVRSIYFDTPLFTAYRDKLDGIKVRKKLRIRSYNDRQTDQIAYLEIKSKNNQRGMKYRAPVLVDDIDTLISSRETDGLVLPGTDLSRSTKNAQRFLFHYVRSSMRPVILVTYEREAFLGQHDRTLRITFDKNMRFAPYPSVQDLFEEDTLRHVAPRYFIMEVKFDHGFSPWLSSVIKKHSLNRTSISKYCSCLEKSGIVSRGVRGNSIDRLREIPQLGSEVEA